jgi:glycosyltransferase involved in cell wall biosynthesis
MEQTANIKNWSLRIETMKEPLVSVKMITYNHAPFIPRAIEGVLNQKTDFPYELVIGEDCSTDGTREIVFEYQNKYPDIIRVITSDMNVGMKKNGYRTTKACRGKYIAYCEGDDYWHDPNKLQKQVDYMESRPECGMVFADCDVLYDELNVVRRCVNNSRGYNAICDVNVEQIISGVSILPWTCTVMVVRSICTDIIEKDTYLHQSDYFLMGDTQLWAEIAAVSKVTYMPECFGTYRVIEESATRSKNQIKLLRFIKSVAEMQIYLCKKYNLSELENKSESLWCDYASWLAFMDRDAGLAADVKTRKRHFTKKDWLRYYAARNIVIHYICRLGVYIISKYKREGYPVGRLR